MLECNRRGFSLFHQKVSSSFCISLRHGQTVAEKLGAAGMQPETFFFFKEEKMLLSECVCVFAPGPRRSDRPLTISRAQAVSDVALTSIPGWLHLH